METARISRISRNEGVSVVFLSADLLYSNAPSSEASGGEVEIDLVVEPDTSDRLQSLASDWRDVAISILTDLWRAEAPTRRGLIGIVLVGLDRIHELNRDFRGKDQPTDVLSFDLSDRAEDIEGEVYIGVDRAVAQAEEIGCSLAEELARLMIHGTLHLAGHDHQDDEEEHRMIAATETWIAEWRHRAGEPEPL